MTNLDIPHVDRVIKGIEIIRKYTDEKYIEAEHDILYFGDYETIEKMTNEEKQLMEQYGWFNQYDSWAIYT